MLRGVGSKCRPCPIRGGGHLPSPPPGLCRVLAETVQCMQRLLRRDSSVAGVPLPAAPRDGHERPRATGAGVGLERHVSRAGQREHDQSPAADAADPVAGYEPGGSVVSRDLLTRTFACLGRFGDRG